MKVSEPNASTTKVAIELTLLGEYIKNLSFESPSAHKFREFQESPELEVGVDVDVTSKDEDLHEVILNLEIHARGEVGIIYHLELSYGGLFRLRNIHQELRQQVLIGDCPKLLFPSIRRVVSDVTYSGGFTPLMLDFGRLPDLAQRQL
jgi:preprotein translocase subunit SecB